MAENYSFEHLLFKILSDILEGAELMKKGVVRINDMLQEERFIYRNLSRYNEASHTELDRDYLKQLYKIRKYIFHALGGEDNLAFQHRQGEYFVITLYDVTKSYPEHLKNFGFRVFVNDKQDRIKLLPVNSAYPYIKEDIRMLLE